ncbi:MAG: hypothetical protein ACKO40_04070 [Planctomycetaceae bacterium]
MGRETKLLLGLLATLFGVFVGVLSMKLLVPRPPAGAGPDVQADIAQAEPQALVEPPPLSADPAARVAPAAPADEPNPPRRFAAAPPAPPEGTGDPFVARASFAEPATQGALSAAAPPRAAPPTPAFDRGPAAFDAAPVPGTAYVARPGDSWWSLAEAVYGDGRLYRALFAWNRTLDPRVSLVAGTSIELPPHDRLAAAWPALMPSPE